MKNLLYVLLLLPFLLGSCDKNLSCKQEELVEAPPEFLQYWYFPKGSYWIYKLQDTVGVYDTVRVVNESKLYCDGNSDPHDIDCEQGICLWMYSNTWQHSNQTYFRIGNCFQKGTNYFYSYYSGNTNTWITKGASDCFSSHAPDYLFMYPFKIGDNNLIISEDTLTTLAGLFPKTIEIIPHYNSIMDSVTGYYVKKLYVCPNVGVIKWQYSRSGIWELIEYDVTP